MPKRFDKWFQYTGAIHIHTTESDGTLTLEEVVAIGREVGLEFMMFADHMTLSNRTAGKEGFYGDTLVAIGYEHNDLIEHHHYLLFDSPRVYPADWQPAQYVAQGAADGALGIIAHPDEIRNALRDHPPYPWTDWSVEGYTGIEIWNQMSEWMEKLTRFNKLFHVFSPRKSIVAPPAVTLARWDALNATRRCVGIAAADAHGFGVKAGPFTVRVFPYKVHFRTLRCYVLLNEPMSRDVRVATHQLYDAIRDCRLYSANVRWGDAEDFRFIVRNGDETVTCGGEVRFDNDTILQVQLPSRATVRIVRDGRIVLEADGDRIEQRVDSPGLYRVEAWKKRRGWIFSNHIRIIA
jgi:hypothetical protein